METWQWAALAAGLMSLLLVSRGVRFPAGGGTLRMVVIWLGIFALLGIVYQLFGPFENFERRFNNAPAPVEGQPPAPKPEREPGEIRT